MKRRFFFRIDRSRFLLVVLPYLIVLNAAAQTNISDRNIRFIEYYGFPEGNSAWDDIGYNPVDNTVYVGITDHKDKVALYIYHPDEDSVKLKGFISDLGNLRPFQWQAKIHSKFVAGPKGEMYFATDGGESREEYLMDHPKGYAGGFLMKWNPSENRMINLGMGMPYESIKDVDIDQTTGNVYAISYPQVHFLVYDQEHNKVKDYGRLGSAHVPRMVFQTNGAIVIMLTGDNAW